MTTKRTKTRKPKINPPEIRGYSDCTVEFRAIPSQYGQAEDFMNHLRETFNLPIFGWEGNNDKCSLIAQFPPGTIEEDGPVVDYLETRGWL